MAARMDSARGAGWSARSRSRNTRTRCRSSATFIRSRRIANALITTRHCTSSSRASLVVSGLLAVLLPWVALDLLWQVKLSNQLEETRLVFGGKSRQDKHLADIDGELYAYARHLRDEVLPQPGPRLFVLNDAGWRGYRRLKLQYYLLPHNIYNFGRYPRPDALRPGDYLLVLDDVPGLDFDRRRSRLRWEDGSLPVLRVDQQTQGSVYLYRGEKR